MSIKRKYSLNVTWCSKLPGLSGLYRIRKSDENYLYERQHWASSKWHPVLDQNFHKLMDKLAVQKKLGI